MNSRIKELSKVGSLDTGIMSDCDFFKNRFNVVTKLPILNVVFSGELDKGYNAGLTMLAGESGTFKTNLALYSLKAYLDSYSDAFGIIYDSEFSITEDYLQSFGIESDRILYIPIKDVEDLKIDIHAKLSAITREDHVFILIDSIGNLVSRKTITDAENEKVSVDMSRAKSLKTLYALITNGANLSDKPIFLINHCYSTQEMYSKTVVSGGRASLYVPNTVLELSRKKDVNADKTLEGFDFTINVLKSRTIRAFSKLSFNVSFDDGIDPNSGLLELAIEGGFIKLSGSWYSLVDENKEPVGNKLRESQILETGFYDGLLKNTDFKQFVKSKFKLR